MDDRADLLEEARWAARALYFGAISDGEFAVCIRNALLRHLSATWRQAGGEVEDRDLLRIQHDALAAIDELASEIETAGVVAEAEDVVEQLGWWYDDATLTGVRCAALKGLVAHAEVLYYGPDFRITQRDVNAAIREAEERVGVRWSGLMEAELWEDRER